MTRSDGKEVAELDVIEAVRVDQDSRRLHDLLTALLVLLEEAVEDE